ncbi:MAG: hypothetical protein PUE14_00300, partial [Clostridia bacterium]|nr:hypothetical protein [Clostridia bacterium]
VGVVRGAAAPLTLVRRARLCRAGREFSALPKTFPTRREEASRFLFFCWVLVVQIMLAIPRAFCYNKIDEIAVELHIHFVAYFTPGARNGVKIKSTMKGDPKP